MCRIWTGEPHSIILELVSYDDELLALVTSAKFQTAAYYSHVVQMNETCSNGRLPVNNPLGQSQHISPPMYTQTSCL
ncbi:hypothetical protein SERLA73DRAFT_145087 [Serpula lacrymans var. lacrymans S7.3]|uniref:Uncharacterized protein n=2 Tax=Serpula lacrymans var. lacrymans TaxID=341189 RepID=F8QD03_SERL3|nr:uncharacterized protein SERLADRAFT_402885 [Serpula lacrymans var. lacrymans S7.9]EGN94018.1 hypothetical protein SERLA73DRAFT_145087 [Serpula lacrymans var. lacrymans S7.3]EGO19373.1 hypothetical protein SERLADRAFT_402885 [Serpula lacrymans var. lacrymans S7.9]